MNGLTIYTDEELEKIQKLETEALKVILRICNMIEINCFLIGGTALGAIRHNGFIPWDDDIDVGMARSDYRLFLEKAPELLPDGYYLQTPYNESVNPYFYSKLRINGTRFVEYSNHKLNMHHGVYVDIFPFDEVPDDDSENRAHFLKTQCLLNLFVLRQSPDMSKPAETFKEKAKAFFRLLGHITIQLVPHSHFVNTIDRHIQKYNGTGQKAMACLNFPVWKTEYIALDDLYPLKKHRFGDIEALIPNNYDTYLKTHYGNYMQLPPPEKRFGHKPYEVELD